MSKVKIVITIKRTEKVVDIPTDIVTELHLGDFIHESVLEEVEYTYELLSPTPEWIMALILAHIIN